MNIRRFSVKSGQLLLAVLMAASSLMGTAIPARAAPSADTALPPINIGLPSNAVAVNPVTNKIYVTNDLANSITVIDGDTRTVVAIVSTGQYPYAVAVNPLTNKIYVANYYSANVTVIDGANNSTVTVSAGTNPRAVAVNPVTNKIYVANYGSDNVTVIDGATNTAVATINLFPNSPNPWAVAVNPVTNKIYVTSDGSFIMTVIDGATNSPTDIYTLTRAHGVAVNPVTNRIYAARDTSHYVAVIDGVTDAANVMVNTQLVSPYTVSPDIVVVNPATNKIYVLEEGGLLAVIDGGTNSVTGIHTGVGDPACALAVNPTTNKIYVGHDNTQPGARISVIDGETNVATTVNINDGDLWVSCAVAVNPVTNQIYFTNRLRYTVAVIDGADNTPIATIAAGARPNAVAINPVTDKVYVANNNSHTVTILDGGTNVTTTISTGTTPRAVAVNPVTNKIYVANQGSASVTVLNGATNVTATISAGTTPYAVAVNPVTDKIYVANQGSNNVTVIDGATNSTATVGVGTGPIAVAANPVTNKIYVANQTGNTVTVIDGATNSTATVNVGTGPIAVAVNSVTNKIYVANQGSNTVTAIDGATNTASTVSVGAQPLSVAVNPVSNKIYVANSNSANMTVIDGATNATTTVSTGTNPYDVVVNPAINKIYVVNAGSATVAVIDGATNAITTTNTGVAPHAVAVNPITNKVYIPNYTGNTVTVLEDAPSYPNALTVAIQPLAGNETGSATPTFSFYPHNQAQPYTQRPMRVYYQLDTLQGAWTATTANADDVSWSATLPTLIRGWHTLYYFAVDGSDVSSINPGSNSRVGQIAAYGFLVRTSWPTYVDAAGTCAGNSPCFTNLQSAISSTIAGGTVTVYPGTYAQSVILNQNVTLNFTGDVTLNGLSQISGTLTAPIGTLTLNGDFAHTGGTFNANNGTVAFIGTNVTRTLTVTVPTQFYNLTVGTGVTLTHSTNNDNTGVNGTLTNNGAIYKSFEFSGVSVIAKVLGGLKALAMLRYDQSHPQATTGIQTNQYWHIEAITTTSAAFNLGLTLPHTNLPDPKVCKYPGNLGGAGWDCARDGFDAALVWRSGISALSDWTVGNLVGPTAVTTHDLSAAATPIGREGPIGLALVVAVLITSVSLVVWRRRQSRA